MRRIALGLALLLAATFAPAQAAPVVDGLDLEVTDPTGLVASDNITVLGTVPNPGVIGARFRDDVMYVTGLHGLVTYDVSDPTTPVEIGRLVLPHFENEDVDLGGDILLISNDAAESTGILYVIDISDPSDPRQLSAYQMGGNPLLGGPGHTASCVLDCRFAWVTDGAGIRVIDLTDPTQPETLGTYDTPAGGGLVTHDVQLDGDGLYWVAGFGGTAGYRLPEDYDGDGLGELVAQTNEDGESTYLTELGLGDGEGYNDYIHHNSLRRAGSDQLWITEEDYARPGCRGAGSFQRWHVPLTEDVDGELVPTGEDLTPIDQWVPELLAEAALPSAVCSAHYFDEHDGLVAHAWYQQGLRFLDVTGAEIRQVGYFITPETLAFSAYFPTTDDTGEVVYLLNAARGIDIVRIDRAADPGDMPAVTAPILPQWLTVTPSLLPHPTYGFACALPL
jgi:hypothetical protein